jgi:hypothetical protein
LPIKLTITDAGRFYASWKDGIRAKAKKLERFKAFVRFCLKRTWLTVDITDDLQPPEGSSIPADRVPLTDADLQRVYAACRTIKATPAGPGHREWTGQDAKDFIDLMTYTGIRISDASTFDVSKRLNGNHVYLRQHKTKKALYTWIPDELASRLRERQEKWGPTIFKTGQSTVVRTSWVRTSQGTSTSLGGLKCRLTFSTESAEDPI